MRTSRRLASALLGLAPAVAALSFAPGARADELRYRDPETCEVKTESNVVDIVEESWTTIGYRAGKATSPVKRIETRFLIDIKRAGGDSNATAFLAAAQELAAGNHGGAREAFGKIAGGGRKEDTETGKKVFRPFPDTGGGKAKWYVDGSIYHYALASYLEGTTKNDLALVDDALRVLDSDTAGEKGFLARWKEGRSRWYADAWILKGKCQVALKKFDEATATFDALYQKVLTTPAIGARVASEAKLGAGRVAEAKGSLQDATMAYDAVVAALQSLLEQAQDPCTRTEYGRFYNEARMQKARILLDVATKNGAPADFAELRKYLEAGSPDGLRQKFAGKAKDVVDAVVAGALTPTVQAVSQNGIGLALWNEKRYAEAVYAFVAVRIKYFSVTEEVPRALHYLVRAAEAAAAAAPKAEAKALYKAQADAARQELQRSWKDTAWAKDLPAPK